MVRLILVITTIALAFTLVSCTGSVEVPKEQSPNLDPQPTAAISVPMLTPQLNQPTEPPIAPASTPTIAPTLTPKPPAPTRDPEPTPTATPEKEITPPAVQLPTSTPIALPQTPAVDTTTPLFRFRRGSLRHDPDQMTCTNSRGVPENALIDVRFVNPYSPAQGGWSYGIVIPTADRQATHAIVIRSVGSWEHRARVGSSEVERTNPYPTSNIDNTVDGTNRLRFVIISQTGWLFINDSFERRIELERLSEDHAVAVCAGFREPGLIPGESTQFRGFGVWQWHPDLAALLDLPVANGQLP